MEIPTSAEVQPNEREHLREYNADKPRWIRRITFIRRKRELGKELSKVGIKNYLDSDLAQKLAQCDLLTLRNLHELASNGTIGSIEIERRTAKHTRRVYDINNSSYKIVVGEGEQALNLHFAPFRGEHKIDELTTEGMFLGCIDLLHTIDYFRERSDEVPNLINGTTNQTLAKLMIKKLGFHPWAGGRGRKSRFEKKLKRGEINEFLNSPKLSATRHIWISSFMKKDDFLGDPLYEKLIRIRDLLYRRLSNDNTPISDEKIDELEGKVRIPAITRCLQNAKKVS